MAASENNQLNLTVDVRNTVGSTVLGILPFGLFGLTCMLTNLQLPIYPLYVFLAFSTIVLLGLVIGLANGFPVWAYSYLGWSIIMTWWWSMISFGGDYNYRISGLGSLIVFLLAIGIGLFLARSVQPLRQLVRGIGEDWTLLSFMMYTFAAFTQLIYDENHHPYLLAFMIGSTLAICLGAWFYLRSTRTWIKLLSLFSGFVLAYIISIVCYATWDWAEYYGFQPDPPQTLYAMLTETLFFLVLWAAILFWPVVIGLAQQVFKKQGTV